MIRRHEAVGGRSQARRVAEVWLNGVHVGTHTDPYVPFDLPAPGLRPGGVNTLVVRVDNRKGYAKLDWTIWTATLADTRAGFEALANPSEKTGVRQATTLSQKIETFPRSRSTTGGLVGTNGSSTWNVL